MKKAIFTIFTLMAFFYQMPKQRIQAHIAMGILMMEHQMFPPFTIEFYRQTLAH